MALPDTLTHWLRELCANDNHRQLLVISGERDWCVQFAISVIGQLNPSKPLWFGDSKHCTQAIPINKFRHYLGQETGALVYDSHAGVRASAMMALSGLVKRGGAMLLLCPPLDLWAGTPDPLAVERSSYGFEQSGVKSVFVQWLISRINTDRNISVFTPDALTLAPLSPPPSNAEAKGDCATSDQYLAVGAICRLLTQDTVRSFVLTADRGRGKSSAMGIAAAKLMHEAKIDIVITAPRPAAAEQVFFHAQRRLPQAKRQPLALTENDASLTFVAPDELPLRQHLPSLILVDEAAAIPYAMLVNILDLGIPCVFSTTVHGYEGSGRGFELRFKRYLHQRQPKTTSLHMRHPIRWYKHDPVERFWFNVMLMAPPWAEHPLVAEKGDDTLAEDGTHLVTAEKLISRPNVLYELFSLLVDAHYQTTQDDLLRILDSLDSLLAVQIESGKLVAVALLAFEGTDRLAGLAKPISQGQRRVKGHLSAQYLAYHFAKPEWASKYYLRIVRIAVQPDMQRQGVGATLVKNVAEFAPGLGVEYLTTSFGATTTLIRFWSEVGFQALKLGNKKDASSGEISVLMARQLGSGTDDLIPYCQTSLSLDLRHRMVTQTEKDICDLLLKMTALYDEYRELREGDDRIIRQCVEGSRPIDNAPALIAWWLQDQWPPQEVQQSSPLLHAMFIQQQHPKEVVRRFALTGKKGLFSEARKELAALLVTQTETNEAP